MSTKKQAVKSEQCEAAHVYIDRLSRILSNLINARMNYTLDWPKFKEPYQANIHLLKQLISEMEAQLK